MYDLFIFHGHGEGDNGAVGSGQVELQLASVLVSKVVAKLTQQGLKVHTNNGLNNYKRNLTKGQAYNHKFGYTIHLNSGGGTGSEIIVPKNESGLDLDFAILQELEKLGFKNRGVKSRDYDTEQFTQRVKNNRLYGNDYYGEIREAWRNGTSLGILEVCFIDNEKDVNLFISKMNEITNIICNEILKVCGKSTINVSRETFNIGDRVKVVNLVDYNNTTNSSWVLNDIFNVMQVTGNRIVIGKDGKVTGAWHKDNLRRV